MALVEMLGLALVQEFVRRVVSFMLGKRKERASHAQGHNKDNMERLDMAILGMEFALEMSAKRPITDVSLLPLRKKIRCAYVQAKELRDKQKLLKAGDVRRLEQFADCAHKFVGDLDSECSLSRNNLCKNYIVRHLFEGKFHNGMATFVRYCDIPTEEGVEEQQKRCSKYSRAAIGFAISTLITCMVSESFSTVDTAVKLAVAAASSVAITAGMLSWRMMKPARGRFLLVYISSFHLLMMTFFVFISLDKAYGYYAALLVPLIIGAVFLRRKLWAGPGPGGGARRQSTADDDEAITKHRLDFMFNLSSHILSLDSFTSIAGHLPSGPNKYYYHIAGAGAAGFLSFSTILLSLYLMMVSTVRTPALTLHAKHLDVLLIVLLVSTLTSTAVAFLYFPDQATEWEVPT